MAKDLDTFLGEEDEPILEAAAEPEAAVATPEPAAPEPEPAAETPIDNPANFRQLREVVEATKRERNDYKGERDRLAGEKAAMLAELEAFRKASVAQPVAAPAAPEPRREVAIPNPVEDPQGYHEAIQRDIFNRSLNMSEVMLRQQVGDDADVDAKVAVFKKLADADPSLRAELQRQAHPYKFVYDHAKKSLAMEEIGGDPGAFRAKIEAEIRAKIEAEYAGAPAQQPAAQSRVVLPQSLGTARSAGPRSAPVMNVPEDFNDILAVGRK